LSAVHVVDDFFGHHVAVIFADQLNAEPMVLAHVGLVAENGGRLVQVGDDGVDPAVVVEIAKADTAADVFALEVTAASPGDVRELDDFSVVGPYRSQVTQQYGPLGTFRFAGGKADGMAVDDKDVFPAVVVEIEERRAPADIRL